MQQNPTPDRSPGVQGAVQLALRDAPVKFSAAGGGWVKFGPRKTHPQIAKNLLFLPKIDLPQQFPAAAPPAQPLWVEVTPSPREPCGLRPSPRPGQGDGCWRMRRARSRVRADTCRQRRAAAAAPGRAGRGRARAGPGLAAGPGAAGSRPGKGQTVRARPAVWVGRDPSARSGGSAAAYKRVWLSTCFKNLARQILSPQ